MNDVIYTHDEAANIVEMFEDVLDEYGIYVPSPDDDERFKADPYNTAKLYGTTFSVLMDRVEDYLIRLLENKAEDTTLISYEFSGRS